jgi:hypothetical protein
LRIIQGDAHVLIANQLHERDVRRGRLTLLGRDRLGAQSFRQCRGNFLQCVVTGIAFGHQIGKLLGERLLLRSVRQSPDLKGQLLVTLTRSASGSCRS